MDDYKKFIFISCSLPTEPSRIRVYVWRWLKKIGALNVQQSLWLLPYSDSMLDMVTQIKDSIEKDGGVIYIGSGGFIHGEEDIVRRFIEERNCEYDELLEYCMKFHQEMRHETEIENFSYAELEENDEEYKKLCSWLEKINKRNYFDAPKAKEADKELELCRNEFEEFSARIYERNNIV